MQVMVKALRGVWINGTLVTVGQIVQIDESFVASLVESRKVERVDPAIIIQPMKEQSDGTRTTEASASEGAQDVQSPKRERAADHGASR